MSQDYANSDKRPGDKAAHPPTQSQPGMRSTPRATGDFDRVVRTVCSPDCTGTCGVNAFVKDDRLIKLEPASYPDPRHERICLKGIAMATQRLHHPDRLTHPLIRAGARGEGKWRRVSWEEAYAYIGERLSRNIANHGARSNAWINAGGNYGYRSMTSTKRVANCLGGSHFTTMAVSSDWAGYIGYFSILGEFGRANDISEVSGARYLISLGRNMADTAHSEMHFLFDAMENGTKFVMVDPRFSRSAAKADEWVPLRPGTDTALAMGMIHVVISEGLMKPDYVLQHSNAPFLVRRDNRALLRECDIIPGGSAAYMVWDDAAERPVAVDAAAAPRLSGSWAVTGADGAAIDCLTAFDALWQVLSDFTPEHASTICGVPPEQIRRIAREYATIEPAWLWLGQGSQRYHHGHITFRAWITLASLCGNIGKPYAGANLIDGPLMTMIKNPAPEWISPGGKEGHSLPGTRLLQTLIADDPYPVRSLWTSATGFATQTPFFERFVKEALPKLELFVVSEQVMTGAAEFADVVLPCVSYFEDDWDLVGSAESWFVQLRRRAVQPVGESRNDFDIYKGLCEHLGMGEDWQMAPEESCRHIITSHSDPIINGIDWDTLRRDGIVALPVERPFTPFRDMKFKTPSGRIELYQEQFADVGEEVLVFKEPIEGARSPGADKYPFQLISYKHVHTAHGTHTILPLIREVLPGPLVEIATLDAESRGIVEGDLVEVFNERGSFQANATITNGLPAGVLGMSQGWWKKHFHAGHPSSLGHVPDNAVQTRVVETNIPLWDIHCDIRLVDARSTRANQGNC